MATPQCPESVGHDQRRPDRHRDRLGRPRRSQRVGGRSFRGDVLLNGIRKSHRRTIARAGLCSDPTACRRDRARELAQSLPLAQGEGNLTSFPVRSGSRDTRRSFDRSVHLDPSIPACPSVPSGLVSMQVRGSIHRSPHFHRRHALVPRSKSALGSIDPRVSLHGSARIPPTKSACPCRPSGDRWTDPRVSLHASARIPPRHALVPRSKCACPSIQVSLSLDPSVLVRRSSPAVRAGPSNVSASKGVCAASQIHCDAGSRDSTSIRRRQTQL